MEFPENVLLAVQEAARNHPSDIPRAVDCAEKAVRALPDFDDLVALLVKGAVQELVYRSRCSDNALLHAQNGRYNSMPKVQAAGPAVERVCQSLYTYRIAGTVLGRVLGADLDGIAESERNVAAGHTFNAELCVALRRRVADDKRVEESVTERQLQDLFKRLQKRMGEAA